jgi:hypothetical protein
VLEAAGPIEEAADFGNFLPAVFPSQRDDRESAPFKADRALFGQDRPTGTEKSPNAPSRPIFGIDAMDNRLGCHYASESATPNI